MQILELLGRRRIAGLALGAVASGVLAVATVLVVYQPGYVASGRVSVGQVVGTGVTQYELAPYTAALISSLDDSGLSATDLGAGLVEAVATGPTQNAANQELTTAVGKALGSLAQSNVNQDEIAVNSTKQVIADLTAQRETIRQAAGATDLPTEYQARTVDLLDLRNRVAAGGPAELKTVLGQKEAELEKLVSHLSDYQAIQQQIDQITQSYSVAATNLALSRTRQDLVSSEPLIENSDSAEISATLTAVRAGLAAAVFFAGIGLLASLMRARKVDSNGELAEEQPPTSRAFGRSSNSVAPYAPKRALRL